VQAENEEEESSMETALKLIEKEIKHYAAHLVAHLVHGFWQEKSIREIKWLLQLYNNVIVLVIDHKNELLPHEFLDSMRDFFSKSGMSVLGGMFLRAVTRKTKDNEVQGLNIWFVYIIMSCTMLFYRLAIEGTSLSLQDVVDDKV
jgi:hypothetical protein